MTPVLSDEIEVQKIQLVRLAAAGGVGDAVADTRGGAWASFVDRIPILVMVVLPTLLAAIYMYGLAATRYESEVKYVVRTPADSTASQVASLVQGSSITRSTDDAYVAKEYMISRDAMKELVDRDGLLAMFEQAGWDVLWRYPTPFHAPTMVDMAKHYLRFVDIEYDHSTGISTLRMQAFSAQDAQRLANALVEHTEAFLNGLSGRAQQDAIQSALRDVDAAKVSAYKALDDVTAFRNSEETVDPTKASAGIVASISSLSLETATTNARLAELTTNTPQSPEIPTLRTRIAALEAQILKQRQQLGGDASSLAPQIETYQRLLLEQSFAEKAFISALTSLETARLDATRQRVFLEMVTTPDLPEYPAYPYRALTVLVTFGVGIAVWRAASTIGRDTREHAH